MKSRRLGQTGPEVTELGLGCMGMSDFYGPADEGESLATLHAALDAGLNLLDTGDFYGMGHNEMLIGRALKAGRRHDVQLSVKFGAQRGPDGAWLGYDARPAAVKTALAYSLKRLGTDYIDIYRPARLDPKVPVEETAGAVKDLIDAGYVRHLGLSEVSAQTVARAHAVTPVVDLQIEYSLLTRGLEDDILPALRALGVGVTAYGVLSRGLISEAVLAGDELTGARRHFPRLSGDNLAHNRHLIAGLRDLARARQVTVAQIAIAWVLARGADIVPLIGARRRERLTEALAATRLALTPEELSAIEVAIPKGAARGTRYMAAQMAQLDSEAAASG